MVPPQLTIAVGSDQATPLTEGLLEELTVRGFDILRFGALDEAGDPRWPSVGLTVGESIAQGVAAQGIVLCWTGTGVTMAANKIVGVRAALCVDAQTAAGARRWNDANVLGLSLRLTTPAVMGEILAAWFKSSPSEDFDNQLSIALLASM